MVKLAFKLNFHKFPLKRKKVHSQSMQYLFYFLQKSILLCRIILGVSSFYFATEELLLIVMEFTFSM